MKKLQYRFYRLTFPNQLELEPALDFFNTAASHLRYSRVMSRADLMVLELWSDKTGVWHRLGIPWQRAELVTQLTHHMPGVKIEEDERDHIPDWTVVDEVGVSDNTRPFNLERLQAQVARIHSAVVAEKKTDDVLVIQWVITPGERLRKPSRHHDEVTSSWAINMLWRGMQADPDEIDERRENAKQNQFKAVLRVAAYSSTSSHAKKLVDNIRKAYRAANTESVRFERVLRPSLAARKSRLNRAAPINVPISFINATELAAFIWPIGNPMIPGISYGRTRNLPPSELIPRNGISLGTATATGYKGRRIAVTPDDLFRHVLIQGPSGNGKTTAMSNLFQQVVEQGHGATMIETKGDLFYRGLDAIPRERMDDVIVIDLSDDAYSVGINLLHEGDARSTVDNLINLFVQGTPDPKLFSEAAFHGWHTLRLIPGTTAVDLMPLLDPTTDDEKEWQQWVIDQLPKNGPLAGYWRSHLSRKEADRRNRIAPVTNRLWKFDSHDTLRRFLGQSESTFSLKDAIRDGKIILIYAPYQIGSDQVNLFVSLMVNQVNSIIEQMGGNKKPGYLFLDEVQRLTNMSIPFVDMLSLWRARKEGLVMANQYMSQLKPDMQLAMTNVGTIVATRMDGPDARHWQSFMGKAITPDDIMNLDPYEGLARVAINGGVSEPLTFKSFEPFKPHGLGEEIVRHSRERYARPAAEVDKAIRKRRTAPARPAPRRASFGDLRVDE